VKTKAGLLSARFRPSDHPRCAAKGGTAPAGGKAARAAASGALCPAVPSAAVTETVMARVVVTMVPGIRN
jgi:hypothetical protein